MTIYTAFGAGITGLQAQSNKIGVIADNISNQSTVGYKSTSADFHTLVSYFAGSAASIYAPGGVLGGARSNNHLQGNITGSSNPTDIAISGEGFFPVTSVTNGTTKQLVYTRAGSFTPGANGTPDEKGIVTTAGYLKNSAGYYLNGWALDSKGDLPTTLSGDSVSAGIAEAALVPVQISQTVGKAIPTDFISVKVNLNSAESVIPNNTTLVKSNLDSAHLALPTAAINVSDANLQASESVYTTSPTPVTSTPLSDYNPTDPTKNMASGSVTPNLSRTVSIIDNLGVAHDVVLGFLKTGNNSWSVEMYPKTATDITDTTGQIATGNVTFGTDGSLASISASLSAPLAIHWNNAGGDGSVSLNLGTIGKLPGLHQLDESYTAFIQPSPDYDPTSATKSMASGSVTPSYTRTIAVLDRTGTARTLTAGFIKTSADTWAVEVYAQPASSVTTPTGTVPGQLASGTLTFDSTTGKLSSISSSLSSSLVIKWSDLTDTTSTTLNWGTLNDNNGVAESNAAFSTTATTPTVNYDPASATKSMSSGSIPPDFNQDVDVVDQDGTKRTVTLAFLKTAVNNWAVEVYAKPANTVTTVNGLIASGTVAFNGDGSLASISTGLSSITATWAVGDPSTIAVEWGTAGVPYGTPGATVFGRTDGLSQTNDAYQFQASQNGVVVGKLSTVSVDSNGYVFAKYDNDIIQKLYKLPLAVFENPDALANTSGNVFEDTSAAGSALYAQAGKSGAGVLAVSSLESSNVDLSSQLTDMVIAQRAYQSNTKTITTTDEMLQTLTQMLG